MAILKNFLDSNLLEDINQLLCQLHSLVFAIFETWKNMQAHTTLAISTITSSRVMHTASGELACSHVKQWNMPGYISITNENSSDPGVSRLPTSWKWYKTPASKQ